MIELDAQMREAAEKLDFERAIELRDAIAELNKALARKMENEAFTARKMRGLGQKGSNLSRLNRLQFTNVEKGTGLSYER